MKTLELNYTVNCPADTVYEQLVDFKRFAELHPYMKTAEITQDHLPEFIEYGITEEVLLLGFIRSYPKYRARVFGLEKNRSLRYTSQVKKYIFLTIEFHLSDRGNGCAVTERIEIEGNPLLTYVFAGILRKSHAQVFENIGKKVAS